MSAVEVRDSAATPAHDRDPLIVIGAGPAGLTAAYELVHYGVKPIVLDQDERVGGLAQTVEYKGFRFDIGGHRFFTKVSVVQGLWRTMLGREFLKRPRLSRIYYHRKLFDYPLKPLNALSKLGIGTAFSVVMSYLRVKLAPIRPEVSFEDWVTNRFGRALYRIFFESYTLKVWGISGKDIRAQWAAQRIRGLNLRTALIGAAKRLPRRAAPIKTLVTEFEYPRFGPGQMWDAFRGAIEAGGGTIRLGSQVIGLHHHGGRITGIVTSRGGTTSPEPAGHVISSMPIRDLVRALVPPAPDVVRAAAERLNYRDFITVAVVIEEPDVFPDNWIYIHEASVRVGRIQNFKNWSADMVPDPSKTCLGLEYFCSEGDDLWSQSDEQLLALARQELRTLGLVDERKIVDGRVVRVRQAYPVYDEGYEEALEVIKQYLARFENLQLVGRNGMHKYNNQDHSMVTAMLAVRNLFGEQHDLWAINADDEYQEGPAAAAVSGLAADHAVRDQLAATQPNQPTRLPAHTG